MTPSRPLRTKPQTRPIRRPGASEADLDAAEAELGVSLPPAFRALYRVHDGQELKLDRDLDATRTSLPHRSMFHGILGGCVALCRRRGQEHKRGCIKLG